MEVKLLLSLHLLFRYSTLRFAHRLSTSHRPILAGAIFVEEKSLLCLTVYYRSDVGS